MGSVSVVAKNRRWQISWHDSLESWGLCPLLESGWACDLLAAGGILHDSFTVWMEKMIQLFLYWLGHLLLGSWVAALWRSPGHRRWHTEVLQLRSQMTASINYQTSGWMHPQKIPVSSCCIILSFSSWNSRCIWTYVSDFPCTLTKFLTDTVCEC